MSTIQRYEGGGQLSRRVGRELANITGGSEVAIRRVEAQADVQAAQVDAITAITQRGLGAVAFITNIEMSLAEQMPAAMTRLKGTADAGAIAVQAIVIESGLTLKRAGRF